MKTVDALRGGQMNGEVSSAQRSRPEPVARALAGSRAGDDAARARLALAAPAGAAHRGIATPPGTRRSGASQSKRQLSRTLPRRCYALTPGQKHLANGREIG